MIDDDASIRKVLATGLRARGYATVVAGSGEEGIGAAAVEQPDVVILDLALPDMDGDEACRRIREWSEVPVVILSAHGAEDRKIQALDDGADDFITKPVSMRDLLARIRVAERHRERLTGTADEPGDSACLAVPSRAAVDPGAAMPSCRSSFSASGDERRDPMGDVPRRRGMRRGLLITGAILLVVITVGSVTALQADALLDDLRAGRSSLERGRAEILDGDFDAAVTDFAAAEVRLSSARYRSSGPLLRAIGALPVVGPSVRGTRQVAGAAEHVAGAGWTLSAALAEVGADIGVITPSGGMLPLEPLARLAAPFSAARAELERAAELLDEPPVGAVRPVVDASMDLGSQVRGLLPTVTAAAGLTDALPTFLGADGPRRYLVAAANPAEARGAVGFVGAYAIMTADRGRVTVGEFRPVQDLPRFTSDEIAPPNPDYGRRYGRFDAQGWFLNVNLTPDFPSAAEAMLTLYERGTGDRVDGVVVADLFLLSALVGDGSVAVPGIGPVAGPKLPRILGVEAREVLGPDGERKELLGDVAGAVFRDFLRGAGEGESMRRLLAAAAQGHLRLYSADPEVQARLAESPLAGGLGGSGTDHVTVVANNASNTKLDAFMRREVAHRVELDPGGRGSTVTRLRFENTAPTSGFRHDIIGPSPARDFLGPGDSYTFLSYFCAPRCAFAGAERDGTAFQPRLDAELGHPVVATTERIDAGEERTLSYAFHHETLWDVAGDGGRYVLTYAAQPTMMPTRLEIEVDVPPGMEIVATAPAMEVDGGRASWAGDAATLRRLEVDFASEPRGLAGLVDRLLRGTAVDLG